MVCKPDLTLRHMSNRKLCMIYILIYICIYVFVFVRSLFTQDIFFANVGEIFGRIKCMPRRYWVSKFTSQRVYDDPTKNKKTLEQKNEVI